MLYNNVGRIPKRHLTSRQRDLLALLIFSPAIVGFYLLRKNKCLNWESVEQGSVKKESKFKFTAYFTAMRRPGFFKHDLPAMIQVPKLSNYDKLFQCRN